MFELLLFVYLGVAIVVGFAAAERGRSAGAWAILSLFASPPIALLALLAFPPKPQRNPRDPRWAKLRSPKFNEQQLLTQLESSLGA